MLISILETPDRRYQPGKAYLGVCLSVCSHLWFWFERSEKASEARSKRASAARRRAKREGERSEPESFQLQPAALISITSGPRCALHDQIQRYNLAHTELEPMQLGTTSKILTPQTQEPNQHVLASVEASTLTISVLVWHSHEFVDRGVYLESLPDPGQADVHDESALAAGNTSAVSPVFKPKKPPVCEGVRSKEL